MRYVVTEVEGFMEDTAHSGQDPGLSVQVLDTAFCHRIVRSWRSEDYAGGARTNAQARELIRQRAGDHAGFLNAGLRPPEPSAKTPRHSRRRSEECRNGHPRTPENTYVKPATGRIECLVCKRAAQHRADAKRAGRRRGQAA